MFKSQEVADSMLQTLREIRNTLKNEARRNAIFCGLIVNNRGNLTETADKLYELAKELDEKIVK